MREALLMAAARKFAARGISSVSVEELLQEADVSRATFYAFFNNKYKLLDSIINPILQEATATMRRLVKRPPAEALEGIIDTYLDLWHSRREGLMLIPVIDAETFERFEASHQALNDAMLEILSRAERADLLRNGSAHYSLKVIAITAIPLLRVYDGHPAADALFRDAMKALLLRSH